MLRLGKSVLSVLMLLCFALFVAGCGDAPVAEASPEVTAFYEKFTDIAMDEDYAALKTAFGRDGTVKEEKVYDDEKVVMYDWDGPEGAQIAVKLKNDKAVWKEIMGYHRYDKERHVVSKDTLSAIHVGMTYDEVKDVMAYDGTLVLESTTMGHIHREYEWSNADGSFIRVGLCKGQVTSVNPSGLQ